MQFTYTDEKLVITADEEERKLLRQQREEDPDLFVSDAAMYDAFDTLIANSELWWLDSSDTGDLTSAPILGILSPEQPGGNGKYGKVMAGRWRDDGGIMQTWYQGIEQRWGFMNYQVRSPLEDLADTGLAVFVSSH